MRQSVFEHEFLRNNGYLMRYGADASPKQFERCLVTLSGVGRCTFDLPCRIHLLWARSVSTSSLGWFHARCAKDAALERVISQTIGA